MNKVETFQDFLANQTAQVSISNFVFNLALAAILGFILGKVYERFSQAFNNRALMARNFILITMTTTVIIFIVKSSLALSLGLVGALSIVRFRTAIKEPEELAYLFISIAVGLGLGADQRQITLLGFFMIVGCILILSLRRGTNKLKKTYHLIIGAQENFPLDEIKNKISLSSSEVKLRRFEKQEQFSEASFSVSISDEKIQNLVTELSVLYPKCSLRFIEPLDIG